MQPYAAIGFALQSCLLMFCLGTRRQSGVNLAGSVWPVGRNCQSGQSGMSQSGQSGKVAMATLSHTVCQSGREHSLVSHSTEEQIPSRSVWHCSQSGSLATLPIWKILSNLATVAICQSGGHFNLGAVWRKTQSAPHKSLQTPPNRARSSVGQSGSLAPEWSDFRRFS